MTARGIPLVCVIALLTTLPVQAQTLDGGPFPDVTPRLSPPTLGPALLTDLTLDPGQVVGPPTGPPPTPRHTGIKAMLKDLLADVKHLPSKENLLWAGAGGGLALAVHPVDDDVNHALVNSDFANEFFKPGAVLGQFGTLLGTATTIYVVGRVRDQPKVSHVGMDLIQSLAISQGLTQAIKHTVRRERPDGSSLNIVSVGPRGRHICLCDGARAPPRVAWGRPGLRLRVVCGDLSPARESPLVQ